MQARGKVTLKGSLSVAEKHCNCCQGKDITVVFVRDTQFNVCAECVKNNCDCGSNDVVVVEK